MKALLLLSILAIVGCSLQNKKPTNAYEARKVYMKQCLTDFLTMDLKPQDTLELCSSIDSLARGR
jgi:hypothetical protein